MKTRLVNKGVISAVAAAFSLASSGASAAYFSVSNSAIAAMDYALPDPPPDIQSSSAYSDTGPLHSSVSAHQDEGVGFVAGDGISFGTIDIGYFAGTADSKATTLPGFIDAGGIEHEPTAQSNADVTADSAVPFMMMPGNLALMGTVATVVVPFDVSGTLSATISPDRAGRQLGFSTASASWLMSIQANPGPGPGPGPGTGMLMGGIDWFGGAYGDTPGLHTLTFYVELGAPTQVTMHYELHSSAYVSSALGVGGRVEGLAAFGSTFRWMGISQVLDMNGDPIDFSIVSDSGFDWTQAAPTPSPVPVPPLAPSLLAAFSAAGALFGRRRRGS